MQIYAWTPVEWGGEEYTLCLWQCHVFAWTQPVLVTSHFVPWPLGPMVIAPHILGKGQGNVIFHIYSIGFSLASKSWHSFFILAVNFIKKKNFSKFWVESLVLVKFNNFFDKYLNEQHTFLIQHETTFLACFPKYNKLLWSMEIMSNVSCTISNLGWWSIFSNLFRICPALLSYFYCFILS